MPVGTGQGSGRAGSRAARVGGVRVRSGVGEGSWAPGCRLAAGPGPGAGLTTEGCAAGRIGLELAVAPEGASGLAASEGRALEGKLTLMPREGLWERPSWSRREVHTPQDLASGAPTFRQLLAFWIGRICSE